MLIQLLAFAWSAENTVWPLVMRTLIDKITTFTPGQGSIFHYMMPLLIFSAIAWIAIDAGFLASGFMLARVIPRFEAQIRMSMFAYVQNHSYEYFANHFAGNIANKINDMTQSATRIMQLIMMLFLPAFVAFVIAASVFYTINPWFTLLLVGWTLLHIGTCLAFAGRCAEASNIHSTARSFLTGKLVDSLTNIISVKLFAKKRYECDYIYKYQKDERQKYIASLTIAEKVKVALSISSFIFPGVLLTWYLLHSYQQNLLSIGGVY